MKRLIFVLVLLWMTKAVADMSWLKADGDRLLNERGEVVVLRAINLGGWLAEEMWMVPFKTEPPEGSGLLSIKDSVSLWSCFERRFGKAEMEKIRTAFRCEWLSEIDFMRMRTAGFNAIRLPFFYDVLEEPNGFYWLDYAIEQAGKYGLYVILDMHGTPGRQSTRHHTGEADKGLFFFDPEMVKKTKELWGKIAARYKLNPVVAGFDLINEPMDAKNSATLYLVFDQIYREVRLHDTKHLIFIEDGFKGLESFPDPSMAGWQNVVISCHFYARDARSEADFLTKLEKYIRGVKAFTSNAKAPFFLGEFNVMPSGKAASVRAAVSRLQNQGISWGYWNYKIAGKMGKYSLWALYNASKRIERIDPFQDSPKTILKKINQLGTENFKENKELIEAFH